MSQKCNHKWGKVIVEREGKAYPSAARMCLKCGQLKVGKNTVSLETDKLNMDGNPIENVSDLYAQRVHGTVYYQDIYFEDTECVICGEKFEEDDEIGFKVNTVSPEHISLVPVHRDCLGK